MDITLIKKATDIKKEVLRALYEHLEEIRGVYILNLEPGEILALTTKTKAIITKKNLKITLVPLELLKKDLRIKKDLKEKLMKAKPILNENLLLQLRKIN